MLAITLLLLCIDIFYILWALSARQKFRGLSIQSLHKALFGFVEGMNQELRNISLGNPVMRGVVQAGSHIVKRAAQIVSKKNRGPRINQQEGRDLQRPP
jgi:hypothetical protein